MKITDISTQPESDSVLETLSEQETTQIMGGEACALVVGTPGEGGIPDPSCPVSPVYPVPIPGLFGYNY